MLSIIAFMVMLMGVTALPSTYDETSDMPNYIQVLLAGYKAPMSNSLDDVNMYSLNDAEIYALNEGKINTLDGGYMVAINDNNNADPALEALANLQRDIFSAYNMSYKIRDRTGRILYREEHGNGKGAMHGFINVTEKDSSAAVHYSIRIEQQPSPSLAANHHMLVNDIHNSVVGDGSSVVGIDNSAIGYDLDGSSSSKKLSSGMENEYENHMPLMMFRTKPMARGYEQVWKKGEGLVVNKEYDLPPSYNYRSGNGYPETEEDEQPLYIFNTKPEIKVVGASQDMYGYPQALEFKDDNKPWQIDNSNKKYQIVNLSSDEVKQVLSQLDYTRSLGYGADGQYLNGAGEFEG